MAEGPMEEAYMRFLSGEMDAFEIIVKELQMPLIHFINRYIGNTSIAEDLAEDVFVEILLHRDRYNFKVKLKTYLFTIARNTAIDYIRKNKRLAPYEVDEDFSPAACVTRGSVSGKRAARYDRGSDPNRKRRSRNRTILDVGGKPLKRRSSQNYEEEQETDRESVVSGQTENPYFN